MKKTIALSALALSLAAAGTTAVAHTYAASLSDSASVSQGASASVTTPDRTGKAGKGFNRHGGMKIDRAAVASLLGLTEEELKTEQQAGKSLAVIAAEKGVDAQKVIDLIASTLKTSLDERLAADTITQTQYDEQAAQLSTRAEELANRVFDAASRGGKDGFGGRGAKIDRAAVASLLGLTEDELKAEQKAGKSLAVIAAEEGVDAQKIVDLITSELKSALDARLSAGTITQAQYDERSAEVGTRAEELANRVFDAASRGGKDGFGGRGHRSGTDTSTSSNTAAAE